MNNLFTKENVLGLLKWRAIQAYREACNESFIKWLTELVAVSEKDAYTKEDVIFLMEASANGTPVAEIKHVISS